MRQLDKAEYTTIGISIFALVVSVFTWVDTHNANEIQKEALQTAEQRWRDEGPKFNLSNKVAIVTTYDKSPAQTGWEYLQPGTTVSADRVPAPSSSLYSILTTVNSGRFTGGIVEVGYYREPDKRIPLHLVFCPETTPSPKKLLCNFPYKLEVADGADFHVSISDLVEAGPCTEYMAQGIKFYVRGANGTIEDTETRVALSNWSPCPN